MSVATLKDLGDAGRAAWDRADFADLETIAREMIARATSPDDQAFHALGLYYLGAARISFHDEKGARAALYEALTLFSAAGDPVGGANVMLSLGTVALELNMNPYEAHGLYEEALGILRAAGERSRTGVALGNLAEVYRQEGDYKRALQAATESLAIFQELDDQVRSAWQLLNIAHLYILRRDEYAAAEHLAQAFELLKGGDNPKWLATYFDMWFMLAIRLERWEIAATIMGFLDHYRDERRVPRLLGLFPWYAPSVERLYESVPNARVEELIERGSRLTLEDADALAHAIIDQR